MTDELHEINKAQEYWNTNELDRYDYILILPETDEALNSRIRAAFERKLRGRSGTVIDGEAARMLVALYSLYAFTDKLIIGSFSLPQGRKLFNFLQSGIAPESVLIDDVILNAL